MARTKPTARMSTGGNAPRKIGGEKSNSNSDNGGEARRQGKRQCRYSSPVREKGRLSKQGKVLRDSEDNEDEYLRGGTVDSNGEWEGSGSPPSWCKAQSRAGTSGAVKGAAAASLLQTQEPQRPPALQNFLWITPKEWLRRVEKLEPTDIKVLSRAELVQVNEAAGDVATAFLVEGIDLERAWVRVENPGVRCAQVLALTPMRDFKNSFVIHDQ